MNQIIRDEDKTKEQLIEELRQLREQMDAMQQSTMVVTDQGRTSELLALRSISKAISSDLDSQTILDLLVKEMVDLSGYEGCAISVWNRDRDQLDLIADYGPDGWLDNDDLPLHYRLSDYPITKNALLQNKYILNLISDPEIDASERAYMELAGLRATLILPAKFKNEVIGVVELEDRYTEHRPSPDDIALLQVFADQAATVIENGRLFNEAQQRANELNMLYRATAALFTAQSTSDLGEQIVQAVVQDMEDTSCTLMLHDETRSMLKKLAFSGDFMPTVPEEVEIGSSNLNARAVRARDTLYVPNIQRSSLVNPADSRTRTWLVVPLISSMRVVGSLDLQSPKVNAFSDSTLNMLAAFAEKACIALDNVQLYDRLRFLSENLRSQINTSVSDFQRVKTRIENILNNSTDSIILSYPDGIVQQTNPAMDKLFGYAPDEMFNRSVLELFCEENRDALKAELSRVVDTHLPSQFESCALHKNGTEFIVEMSLAAIDNHGSEPNILWSVRDITERKQAEQALREAYQQEKELSHLKMRFMSMINHEFRTPLSVIQVHVDTIRDYGDRLAPEKKSERFKIVHTQIKRLTEMLDDVLLIGKSEDGEIPLDYHPIQLNLITFFEAVIQQMEEISPEHEIILNSTMEEPYWLADSKLIHQIISNLLTNACKYSPKGSPIRVDLSSNDEYCTIKVTDKGIGIPAEEHHHIFHTSFYRASNVGHISGTGLGLPIVFRAVDAHRGSITFDSEEGAGTVFTIKLPRSETVS